MNFLIITTTIYSTLFLFHVISPPPCKRPSLPPAQPPPPPPAPPARAREPVEILPDRIEPRDVLRRRDEVEPHRPPLVARPDLLDPHPVLRRVGDREQHLFLLPELRVHLADVVAEY